MSDSFFSGSYQGNQASIPAESSLECKICWEVYDPRLGDAVWQIPAGTAFADLPDYWSCPNCGAPKSDFLLLDAE